LNARRLSPSFLKEASMKVVLFCGGQGMRMREYSESIPKPMVTIGHRPILWHVMRYYAHFGHKEFILCLGAKSEVIKDYFLNYDECLSNDFVLSSGGAKVSLLNSDIHDWNITFVDTGPTSNIGQRLKAVQRHLDGEKVFLANYADGLSDLSLPTLIDYSEAHNAVATFVAVKPPQSWHAVDVEGDGYVRGVKAIANSDVYMNGGYFVLRNEIFDYMREGEELVCEPFERLIQEQRLCAYKYEGFWGAMDTFKEKQRLDDMHARGNTPWEVWKDAPLVETVRPVAAANGRRPGLINTAS
jgi:glucose-1-phosphate cytidylyltransferase